MKGNHVSPLRSPIANDPVAQTLAALGFPVTPYRFSPHPNSLYIGSRVYLRTSELIYRRPEDRPEILLIVLYRRLGGRAKTLANPFSDLFWFLRLCTEERFGLVRILCHISTVCHAQGDGLNDARMIRFCERILGADWTTYDGHPWLYRDAVPLRERLVELTAKEHRTMNEIEETIKRNQEQIRQGEALLQKADRVRDERDRALERAGLSLSVLRDYLQGDSLDADERAAIDAEIARFEKKLAEEEQRLLAEQSAGSSSSSPRWIGSKSMV